MSGVTSESVLRNLPEPCELDGVPAPSGFRFPSPHIPDWLTASLMPQPTLPKMSIAQHKAVRSTAMREIGALVGDALPLIRPQPNPSVAVNTRRMAVSVEVGHGPEQADVGRSSIDTDGSQPSSASQGERPRLRQLRPLKRPTASRRHTYIRRGREIWDLPEDDSSPTLPSGSRPRPRPLQQGHVNTRHRKNHIPPSGPLEIPDSEEDTEDIPSIMSPSHSLDRSFSPALPISPSVIQESSQQVDNARSQSPIDDDILVHRTPSPMQIVPQKRKARGVHYGLVDTVSGSKEVLDAIPDDKIVNLLLDRGRIEKPTPRIWFLCQYKGERAETADVILQTVLKKDKDGAALISIWGKVAKKQ